jgi:ferric-dicitrate binding protein FerR (iron transport regulator)
METGMNQYDFNKLAERYLAGECTPEEEAFMDKWSQQFSACRENDNSTKEETEIKKRTWKKLEAGLSKKAVVRKLFYRAMAVAALMAGLFIGYKAFFSTTENKDTAMTVRAEQKAGFVSFINTERQAKKLQLDDGTVVELRPNSSLKYPSRFAGKQRNVYLTGEAFFDVKRDEERPFFVHAGGLITEVLGTSFTIKSLSKSVEVAVVSGKVSVYENGSIKAKSQLILTPNQKAVYQLESRKLSAGIVETPAIINPEPAQANPIFDDVPLQDVVRHLEKGYGLKITLQNEAIRSCLFSGDLKDLPLMEQLDLICKAVNARHRVAGNTINIEGGDSCQ